MDDRQDNETTSGEVPVLRRILDDSPAPGPWDGPSGAPSNGEGSPGGVFIDPAPTFGSTRIADLHHRDEPRVVPAGEPLLGDYRASGSNGTGLHRDQSARSGSAPVAAAPAQLAAPDPTTVVPVPPPPLPVAPPAKRSPVVAILLGLALVAAAAFAFLWHKAADDTTNARDQVAVAQTALVDANTRAAADLAAARKTAADAATAAQQALDAANAKASTDAHAAAAKAQADQAAAVAKATADATATGQATAAGLQAQLDAATAAVAAAQAKATTCKSVSDAVTAMIPSLNELVKLRDADGNGDTAAAQAILSAFDLPAFNAQAAALNNAQAACNAA